MINLACTATCDTCQAITGAWLRLTDNGSIDTTLPAGWTYVRVGAAYVTSCPKCAVVK